MVSNLYGDTTKEDWYYASVTGIIVYLSPNSITVVSFDVYRFSHLTNNMKSSREKSVKSIYECLQGTRTEGVMIALTRKMEVNFYVDADSVGLYVYDDT